MNGFQIEIVVDEIKTHLRVQQKVLRSHTPEGVRQELYALFVVHFAMRALMYRSALQAELDPDRLSFTEAVFQLCETVADERGEQHESSRRFRTKIQENQEPNQPGGESVRPSWTNRRT